MFCLIESLAEKRIFSNLKD